MKVTFLSPAWEDYLYWQKHDKQILKKVNELIKHCYRDPFKGPGKLEPLKENLSGWWSRRINFEHRLVYREEEGQLFILQCRRHY